MVVIQRDERRGLELDGGREAKGDGIRGDSWTGETESLKSAAREEKKIRRRLSHLIRFCSCRQTLMKSAGLSFLL